MPLGHGYQITADDDQGLAYEKVHDNGETTTVQIDKVGTEAAGGTQWLVNVTESNGNRRLGKFPTKQEARQRATQWMNNHPKGVQGPGGAMGAINAMDAGVRNIMGGGDGPKRFF